MNNYAKNLVKNMKLFVHTESGKRKEVPVWKSLIAARGRGKGTTVFLHRCLARFTP